MARQPLDLRKDSKPKASAARKPLPPAEPPRESPRRAPLRVRRRRKRLLIASLVLLVIGAILYAIHWASYLPQYSIQDIQVSGTVSLSQDDIRDRIQKFFDAKNHLISPRSVFWHDEKGIERMLESDILHIADARVSHTNLLSTSLTVAIDERVPFAQWCPESGSCYVIDRTGFIFALYDASSTTLGESVVFSGGVSDPDNPLGHSVSSARFPSLQSLVDALGQAGYAVAHADIDKNGDLGFTTQEGFTIYAASGAEPLALVRDLKLVLDSDTLQGKTPDLEYVDLRFGNRVFYKLKGQEAVVR
jgi:cell division septal protein FtsQ